MDITCKQVNKWLDGKYTVDTELRGGACSKMFLDSPTNVVVKVLSAISEFHSHAEIAAGAELKDCVHVLRLVEVFKLSSVVLVFSPICHGDLFEYLENLECPPSEETVAKFIRPVLIALQDSHQRGILHADVKPENMLLKKDLQTVLLCDFGHSWKVGSSRNQLRLGTPHFYPPEYVCGIDQKGQVFKMDMWALGVTVYEMLTQGEISFDDCKRPEEFEKILYDASFPMSETAKSFINGLLCVDPVKRMDVDTALHHEFFSLGALCGLGGSTDLCGSLGSCLQIGNVEDS